MIIKHNLSAFNARNKYYNNLGQLRKNLEKLSSGYRINRAGDDAAGLAISEEMRAQIHGLDQAYENAEDGIGLIQTADGAMQEVHNMLERGATLATEAANGTLNDEARQDIQKEIDEIKKEVDRIGEHTDFNGIKILKGEGIVTETNELIIDGQLPKGVVMDGASAASGIMSDTYQGSHAASVIDFSNFEEK